MTSPVTSTALAAGCSVSVTAWPEPTVLGVVDPRQLLQQRLHIPLTSAMVLVSGSVDGTGSVSFHVGLTFAPAVLVFSTSSDPATATKLYFNGLSFGLTNNRTR